MGEGKTLTDSRYALTYHSSRRFQGRQLFLWRLEVVCGVLRVVYQHECSLSDRGGLASKPPALICVTTE